MGQQTKKKQNTYPFVLALVQKDFKRLNEMKKGNDTFIEKRKFLSSIYTYF